LRGNGFAIALVHLASVRFDVNTRHISLRTERFQKYCHHSGERKKRAVFLGLGIVLAQLQGFANLLLRQSLAQTPKILAPNGDSISSNALAKTIRQEGGDGKAEDGGSIAALLTMTIDPRVVNGSWVGVPPLRGFEPPEGGTPHEALSRPQFSPVFA
jgi:hypothetical protein